MPTKPNVELTDYVATRWYRSPELILQPFYGKPADIWAVGCIMGEMADGEALFDGQSEIDQLYKIQKVLGEFPDELNEQFSKNPRYLGYKFPDLSRPESLEKRYVGKLSKKALDLLSGMLQLLPENRLTAVQALAHPYFNDVRDPEMEAYLKSKMRKANTKSITRSNIHKEKLMKRLK
jgi:cyclin-dependent kinase-like